MVSMCVGAGQGAAEFLNTIRNYINKSMINWKFC